MFVTFEPCSYLQGSNKKVESCEKKAFCRKINEKNESPEKKFAMCAYTFSVMYRFGNVVFVLLEFENKSAKRKM